MEKGGEIVTNSKKPESNKLRGILAEKRITYAEMSKIIGISENTFSVKMNGHRSWQFDEMIVITKILGFNKLEDVFPEYYAEKVL